MDVEIELGSLDKCRYALKLMKKKLKKLVDDERTERSRLENYLHRMIEMPRPRGDRLTEHNQRSNLQELIESTRLQRRKVAGERKLLQLLRFCDEVRTEEKQIIQLIKQTDLNLSKQRSRIALKCRGRGTQPILADRQDCKIIRTKSQTLKSWSVWSMEQFKCRAQQEDKKDQLCRFLRQKIEENQKSLSPVRNAASNFLPPIKHSSEKRRSKKAKEQKNARQINRHPFADCQQTTLSKNIIKERLREKLRKNKENFIS